jgi:hypothetical protein
MRYNAMQASGATAISSDMMFGDLSAKPQASAGEFSKSLCANSFAGSLSYEDARVVAGKVAMKAAEKASALKAAGVDFFAQFMQQQ